MNLINDWQSAVNFVSNTNNTYIHKSGCILNKSYNYIEINYNRNSYSIPVENAPEFLSKLIGKF